MSEKRPPRNRFRGLIRKVHMVLGLAIGLVVFIVAVTGCLWVFQEEIGSITAGDRTVEKEARPVITPTKAKQVAEAVFPGRSLHGVLYGSEVEAVEVIFYEADPEFYRAVFLNPYSGEVIETEDYLSGFFAFVLDGHLNLWLPPAVGSQIVSWSCLIFVSMLITGIILWWPRNTRNRKQRFRFLWKSTTRWKRKNFDLHAVVGFYASILALLAAYTGLVMAFEWFEKVTYAALGGDKSVVFTIPDGASRPLDANHALAPIDQLLPKLQTEFPQAEQFELHYPHTDSASIYVEITHERGVFYSSDYRFYDQHTLAEVETPSVYGKYENADFPDKVIRMNYDIHVGAILGLPGKILVFLTSLVVASLPVTGSMLWWGRGKKGNERIHAKANQQELFEERRINARDDHFIPSKHEKRLDIRYDESNQ